MTHHLRAGLLPLLALLTAGAMAADVPAPGRYAGQFCVTSSADKPSCGAAEIDLRSHGALRVKAEVRMAGTARRHSPGAAAADLQGHGSAVKESLQITE